MGSPDIAEGEAKRRRSRIILAAAELFLERGADAVRMTDIAEASGIGVASLYRYFGTKSALLLESGTLLWQDVGELFAPRFRSARYEAAPGLGQLEILLGGYIEVYEEHRSFLRLLADVDKVILAERPDPEALRPYRESILNFYGLFRAALEKGEADGSVRPGLDPRFTYRTITDLLNGAAQKFIRGEVLPEDDYSQGRAELELFVRMALGYMAAPNTEK